MTNAVQKNVIVMARHDPVEAMRVASGITIFGHHVTLVFAHGILVITPEVEALAEILELAEVEPYSLFDDTEIPHLEPQQLLPLLRSAEVVINA